MKPIIIAICGKSATGKTTLVQYIKQQLPKVHVIVSTTTRPKRENEEWDAYHFSSKTDFEIGIKLEEFLEYCQFRGWYYGTEKTEISTENVNVGIFNPAGMKALAQWQDKYTIVPIYCVSTLTERIRRSIKRDGFKIEILRRAFTDWKDFLDYTWMDKFNTPMILYVGSNMDEIVDYVRYWTQYLVVQIP